MGRIDDVLNVSGHRLGTMEIESALVGNPLVAEAAVVGKPDEIKTEAIVAFVVLKGARPEGKRAQEIAVELRSWVAKEIGPIARPDEIRFGDNLPKTRSGKIMRRLLRTLAKGEEITQDVSTLENPAILEQLKLADRVAASSAHIPDICLMNNSLPAAAQMGAETLPSSPGTQSVTDYDNGISAIDADYLRPGLAAIHLIRENGQAALVDTGTSSSVAGVMNALREKNLAPADVAYVFLTHIHLDHAGGAGEFMHQFPNARLVVHPRGARHMADPARLIASAMTVYGEAEFRRIYGAIRPVDAEPHYRGARWIPPRL